LEKCARPKDQVSVDPVQNSVSISATQSIFRASISSLVATAVDAAAYQALLFVWLGHYGLAAATAAVAGAITNFLLNRQWAFSATEQSALVQAARYVVVSTLTFVCLRLMLWLFIEVMAAGMRVAWLPAKILAFLLVSYPMQRWWVFRARAA
jgi:putative flippase GtrA